LKKIILVFYSKISEKRKKLKIIAVLEKKNTVSGLIITHLDLTYLNSIQNLLEPLTTHPNQTLPEQTNPNQT